MNGLNLDMRKNIDKGISGKPCDRTNIIKGWRKIIDNDTSTEIRNS